MVKIPRRILGGTKPRAAFGRTDTALCNVYLVAGSKICLVKRLATTGTETSYKKFTIGQVVVGLSSNNVGRKRTSASLEPSRNFAELSLSQKLFSPMTID